MSETSETESETVICLYPGCENPAVPPPKHGGPPPRYCENEEHNASSTYQAQKKAEDAGAAS
ncbi:MAG: hypothetical protein ACR2LK_11035 [Solirubrobacteraceae bacterium]